METELHSMISHFRLYEIPGSQEAAKAVVPYDFLFQVAESKYDSTTEDNKKGKDREKVVKDMFLLEILNWFKSEFFSWMDSPNCPYCNRPTSPLGSGQVTPAESQKGAGRVELFTCSSCFPHDPRREVARFPRYNDPVALFQTRTGRCGEWANCFTLILRAAGFEVRHVRDWTDHVWVEVFSNSLSPNRWVHADPCENKYDCPLMYEKGWGKKLSYVIAVSQDDIQDVTWRYVQEFSVKDVLGRRNLIKESSLVSLILRLKRQMQGGLSLERRQLLENRLVQELVELLYPRKTMDLKESEMGGRESGSLAWRLARQELGSGDDKGGEGKTWKLGPGKHSLTYNSAKDQYYLSGEIKQGIAQGTRESRNIFRKVEHDWNMVYLARKEHSTTQQATISWQFETSSPSLQIVSVQTSFMIATFKPSASILMTLEDNKGRSYKLLERNDTVAEGVINWESDSTFEPCSSFTLSCKLEGGEGNTGWQHAQLFRQSLNSTEPSLKIVVKVLKK